MHWLKAGLNSRVGMRMLFIFCLSSLVPLFAFALVSFSEVSHQLQQQTSERLHRSTKSIAHAYVGQLLLLTDELKAVAAAVRNVNTLGHPLELTATRHHFLSLAVQQDGNVLTPLFGEPPPRVTLPAGTDAHLASGRSLLICTSQEKPKVVMGIALDPEQPHQGIVLGQPDASFLFGVGNTQVDSPGTSIFLLDDEDQLLSSSSPLSDAEVHALETALPGTSAGEFQWSSGQGDFLAYRWSIPLAFEFRSPPWTVVRSESASQVFAPLKNFERSFLLLTAITVLIAVALSSVQIRRNLTPLAELHKGTRRIARGDFSTAVQVTSGDEFEELARSFNAMSNEIHELHLSTLTALARTVDAKSPWTAGHSERVCELALAIGTRLGLSNFELVTLQRGALLHDIGKIGVSTYLLDKPGALTDAEMDQVRCHPVIGARILEPIRAFSAAIPLVRHHHERIDGEGYPDRLRGDAIGFDVRILTVADSFDAMISDRPYRRGMTIGDARLILEQEMGRQFDPVVAYALLELLEQPGFAETLRSRTDSRSVVASRPVPLEHPARTFASWKVQ